VLEIDLHFASINQGGIFMGKKVRVDKTVPECWGEYLAEFIYFKKAQGLSECTLNDYQIHVTRFCKRFPDAFKGSLKKDLYAYMSQQVKPATYNLRLIYLRTFLTWCVEEGYLDSNPLVGFKKRQDEGRVVDVDEDIIRQLLLLPDQKTFAGIRDYALIILTLDTGIRPGEAFGLMARNIDSRTGYVVIEAANAKTRSMRGLPITHTTSMAIRNLLSVRHEKWGDDVPVFCTCDGGSFTATTWGDRLEMYCKKLGVHLRPYDLRHAFATLFLRQGGNVFALQKMMGHKTLSMTKRYIAITENDLSEQHEKASPVSKMFEQKQRVRKV
jgi:site-specific recombinase XerD